MPTTPTTPDLDWQPVTATEGCCRHCDRPCTDPLCNACSAEAEQEQCWADLPSLTRN